MDENIKSFDDAVADLSLRSAQNDGSVHGAAIERYFGGPNEGFKAASPQHILTMNSLPARFETAVRRHNSVSYVKAPGALYYGDGGFTCEWPFLVCPCQVISIP